MDTTLIARGGVPVSLDRERILFFTADATFQLYRRYGPTFWRELMEPGEGADAPPVLKSLDALQMFLWLGLQEDARRNGEDLQPDRVREFIRPMSINTLVNSLSIALTVQNFAPEPEEKADAATAGPAAVASEQRPSRSTSRTASVSRSVSSDGRRSGSGRRRSRK